MNIHREKIVSFIDAHRDEMIDKWKTFVNLEGHYEEKEAVERAQAWLRNELEQEGFECYIRESRPDRAGVLVGILGKNRPGKPIIFSGHVDTVHRTGAFGKPEPFEIRDGKAYGPGVLDMKGGIIVSLYVVKALREIGYDAHPIKMMYAGEEEGDHLETDIDEFFTKEASGALCAFNMETGHISNSLCIGRKSVYTLHAAVRGLGGHAGNEFTTAKNAVHEAIYKCAELMKLTDLDKGTTITISIFDSGGNTGTSAIPDCSNFAADMRISSSEEGQKLLSKVNEIMQTNFIEGTTTEYEIDIAKIHPFKTNDQVLKLFDFINKVAIENEFTPFGSIQLGGGSDAGAIGMAGIPVLCSCGVIGQYNHNIREYAVVESLFNRAKIYAVVIDEMKNSPQW